MVVHHVEQYLDVTLVRLAYELLQIIQRAELRIHLGEVVYPVAVEAPVLELSNAEVGRCAGIKALVHLLLHRIDPDRRDSEIGQFVEMLRQALEVSAVIAARIVSFDMVVVGVVTIGKTVDENEI